MTNLEQLRKNALGKFLQIKGVGRVSFEEVEEVITHVYESAVRDCISSLPALADVVHTQNFEEASSYNWALERTKENLQALISKEV